MIKPAAHPATEARLMTAMEIIAEARKLQPALHPVPKIGPDEVLIEVAYIGINRADLMQRDGKYPAPEGASPLPGLEVSGRIAEVGRRVIEWSVGEEVCALLSGGGYAQYVAVPAGQLLPLPGRLTLAEGACLPEAAATSVMALVLEARLEAKERVLIHGGTSGVGFLMAQIARRWGADVLTTVGSDEKIAWLKEYGVEAINHRASPFAEQIFARTQNEGVDVIIDTLGAPQLETHLKLLRRGGRLISLAMMEGSVAETARVGRMLTHRLRWSGTTLRSRTAAEKAEIIDLVRRHVWPHVSTARIKPAIAQIFPLADAEKALAALQERLHLGKILLEVPQK